VTSIDGVDTPSGNLPLCFLLCHIIVLLSWQINSLSFSARTDRSFHGESCQTFSNLFLDHHKFI